MEDIDIGDDRDSHSHEKQPLTSTPRSQSQSQSQSPYSSYQQQQWRPSTPRTPGTPKLGSPLSLGSPLTSSSRANEQGQGQRQEHPFTPPTRRTTGEFSRQWKSPPTRGIGFTQAPSSPNPMASQRTSSETIRPPSRRSSMSSIRSMPVSRGSMDLGSGSGTTLPGKYIGPEMNKVLHRKRLSESGILIGNEKQGFGEGRRGGFTWRFWRWGDAIGRRSMLRWVPDVLWILGGLGCLIAIAIILKAFDGSPQPEWPGPFNLNTVVAFLTILAQTAYLVPVVEGLGQLYWLRYSSGSSSHGYGIPRPLRDFAVIDTATRGSVSGSLRLLFGYRQGGLLGVLGALIILTSIFTTPLTQGMIVYTADLIPGDGGFTAVPTTHNNTSSAPTHAYTNQTTVHVQWGYLLPLLVQIVLSAVLLASVVIWTRLEGIQILKTSSLATMVALRDDADGLDDTVAPQGTSGIGSVANLRELERKASTLMVRLEKDPLSGLAMGLVPVYDVGDVGGGGGGGGGFMSRKEDIESKLTGGTNILRTRMSSAKDRRRKLNRNTRIVGGVVQ